MIAHNNRSERIVVLGDSVKSASYLPFARKKAKETCIFVDENNLSNYTRTFNIPDNKISILIKVEPETVKITISSETSKTIYSVNGIARYCINKNDSLNEFIYKGTTKFIDLKDHGIIPNQFISTLGYNVGNNTQHKFIKGSKYTGIMKHMIQNMLSENKQLNYNFSWENTDGCIIELVRTQKEVVNNSYNAEVFKDMVLTNVKISKDGMFIKKSTTKLPQGINYSYLDTGFCGRNGTSDTLSNYNKQYARIDHLFTNTSLNTQDLSVNTVLTSAQLNDFYSKQPFFKSSGWLFLSNPAKSEVTQVGSLYNVKTTHLMFNTCHDNINSYLYCIELVSNGTYNPNNTDFFATTYTAKLKLLMQGKMSSLPSWLFGNSGLYLPNEAQNKTELFNKTFIKNETDILDFAPVYVLEKESFDGLNLKPDDYFYNSTINDYQGTDIPNNNDLFYVKVPKPKPETTYNSICQLKVVGLIDIIQRDIVYQQIYDENDFLENTQVDITREISNVSLRNVLVDTHKNLLTNNYVIDLPIVYNQAEDDYEVFNYSGYTFVIPQLIKNGKTYYADGGVLVNSIGNSTKNNQSLKSIIKKTTYKNYINQNDTYETELMVQNSTTTDNGSVSTFAEKIIIPMDDRNSIISVSTSTLSQQPNLNYGAATFNNVYIKFPVKENESYLSSEATYTNMYIGTNVSYTYLNSQLMPIESFKTYPYMCYPNDFNNPSIKVKYSNLYGSSNTKTYFATKINNYIKSNTSYIGISMVFDVYGDKFVYNVEDNINTINYINNYPVFTNYQNITFIGKP